MGRGRGCAARPVTVLLFAAALLTAAPASALGQIQLCGLLNPCEEENLPPQARIEIVRVNGLEAHLCDRSTDPEGREMERSWDLGDGSTSTEGCPVHRYARAGSYTVTLTVTDDEPQSAEDQAAVGVQALQRPQGSTSPRGSGTAGTGSVRSSEPRPVVMVTVTARPSVLARPVAPPANAELAPPVEGPGASEEPAGEGVPWLPLAVAGMVLSGGAVTTARRRAHREPALQAEAALAPAGLDRLATDLISNVSHELRTPLTPVKGYAKLLESERVPREKAREYAGAILAASDRLERVIDELIGVAQIDAGTVRAERKPVRLRPLVDEAAAGWRARYPARPIRVTGGSRVVGGDRRLILLALDQMMDNAVKFSPEGSKIRVAVRATAEGAAVDVIDRGKGIAPEDAEEVFADFRQADGSSTRRYGGLGLGLGLVRRVARMHGGEVTVGSEPGAGSTFSLILPSSPPVRTSTRPKEPATLAP